MQLIFVVRRRRASLEVADVAVILGDDERSLKLPRLHGVDAKVRRQLHGTVHTLGDVAERPVAEHGAVECGVVVVRDGYDASHVLFDEVRVLLDGLADGAEDDASFGELLAEGGCDGHAVEHGVDGNVAESFLFVERDSEFVERRKNFRVDVVETFEFFLFFGFAVVDDVLVVHLGVPVVAPLRLFHFQPRAVCTQSKLEHPLRFVFLRADCAYGILAESLSNILGFDVGDKSCRVLFF
mmetsp:Transcript_11040/g.25014  ORF Transcript_11040/g.25014 Transcript_11040/m.25014 type:complete len:239 (+) Transcript_11040:763-1479(+)